MMLEDLSHRIHFLPKKNLTIINDANKLKMHNHLPYNWHLGNKKAMFYNLR